MLAHLKVGTWKSVFPCGLCVLLQFK
jgi:hypothetical protein